MKQTRLIMGMPVTVEISGSAGPQIFEDVFDYFDYVDKKYSTYKADSEISKINRGLPQERWSEEMCQVLELCEQTKRQTGGFFDIRRKGTIDPSGLVKGWAIRNAADILRTKGYDNFYIDAGGDIQVSGHSEKGGPWKVGIRNPFNRHEIIKALDVSAEGVATSGTAIRGRHIYNPKTDHAASDELASITVVGPDIYDADRFATAAFAMGREGISFIESLPGYEGYMVGSDKVATMTSGLERYASA